MRSGAPGGRARRAEIVDASLVFPHGDQGRLHQSPASCQTCDSSIPAERRLGRRPRTGAYRASLSGTQPPMHRGVVAPPRGAPFCHAGEIPHPPDLVLRNKASLRPPAEPNSRRHGDGRPLRVQTDTLKASREGSPSHGRVGRTGRAPRARRWSCSRPQPPGCRPGSRCCHQGS